MTADKEPSNARGSQIMSRADTIITNVARQLYADPARRDEFLRVLYSDGSLQNSECQALRKDGSSFWVSLSARAIRHNGRVSTLVNAMKEFSHPGTKEKCLLDLNRAIGCTITVARNEWKYVADIETDFDSSLPLIPCSPGEFNQVILNLIVNAAHAIADVIRSGSSDKGKIRIATKNFPGWAEIRIEDTGSGIPQRGRSRVFDPFVRLPHDGKSLTAREGDL